MGLEVTIEVDMVALRDSLQKKINRAQDVLTTECRKAADVYTPERDGDLKRHVEYTYNDAGARDGWRHKERYARRQWWGFTDAGKPFSYSKAKNSNARSRWTEYAAIVFKDHIISKVKAALGI